MESRASGLINSWLKSPESSPPASADEPNTRGQGFAKKRWLRQAISEESDLPSVPDNANSPTEAAAPPKKRRLARESVSEDHAFTPPTTPTQTADGLSQCGSSQESEGPDSPANTTLQLKTEIEVKNEEDTEESDGDISKRTRKAKVEKNSIKQEFKDAKEKNIKEEEKDCNIKEEKMQAANESREQESNNSQKSAAAIATKRKLSISEYRQRKQQGGAAGGKGDGEGEGERAEEGQGGSGSLVGSPASPPSTSSSEDEDHSPTAAIINKSLLLEAALDSAKKPPAFDSAPTLVERQRENLTQRLKREFGLFLSDDEEQEKARKQANVENKAKEQELSKRKAGAIGMPTPPRSEGLTAAGSRYQQLFFPGVGHPLYNRGGGYLPAATAPAESSLPAYGTNAYFDHAPH